MAAGLGFKTFTTGEVLTAADTNGYLMQGILVFASAAARDAAITSPQEGQACYLKDTNQVLTYSGSAWVAVGGGSPLTTKGDVYGFSTVDARIPIGANDTVLTADSTQSLGLKWATPTGASFVGAKTYFATTLPVISNNSTTTVNWDGELWDTDSIHDLSTNTSRFTIPAGKGGYWQVVCGIFWPSNNTRERQLRINVNGTNTNRTIINSPPTGSWIQQCTNTLKLVATDYITISLYQNSGGSLTLLNAGEYDNFCSVYYLGA